MTTEHWMSMNRPKALSDDVLDFMPDILSMQLRPPSALGRVVLHLLLAMLAVALIWSAVGRLDIIAVANGKIVPERYLQIVQPAESGIVKELLVKEGDEVATGQVLARMDRMIADADIRALQTDLQLKRLQLRRIDAELRATPIALAPDDAPELHAKVQAQFAARRQAYLDSIATEEAVRQKARHDLGAAEENVLKLRQTVPIYKDQAEAWDRLADEGYAGRLLALDRRRLYIESRQELQALLHTIEALKATMNQSEKRIAQIASNYQQQLHNERIEAEGSYHRLQEEWEKQSHKHSLLELRAPQNAVVKDLATHTAGSVVAPGSILMTLVPLNGAMQAEVWVNNLDAGFVEVGQRVRLKVAAYPFQKYGMADGKVRQISPDATDTATGKTEATEKLPESSSPSGYRAIVSLDAPHLEAQGRRYRIAPGMQVVAEIHLGTRTVLEFLISPVQKIVHEAGRER
jgi:HlyD family secretion protein